MPASAQPCFGGPGYEPADLTRQIETLRPFFDEASPKVDILDLDRRVSDLEERAREQDRAAAARSRLRELGLIVP